MKDKPPQARTVSRRGPLRTAKAALSAGSGDAANAALQDAACEWIARLQSDQVSDADREAFALWLAQRPEHRSAMDAMLDMWSDLVVLSEYRGADLQNMDPRDTDLHGIADSPLIQSANAQRTGTRSVARLQRWFPASVALAASLLLAVLLVPQWSSEPDVKQYRTAQGEQERIVLADGSTLELNTSSRVEVRYRSKQRDVLLVHGEAFFTVAADKSRPFVVTAGATEVRALGTAFNVHLQGDTSEVTVAEGVVRVSEREPPAYRAAAAELLYPNQQLQAQGGNVGKAIEVIPASSLAWREGKLVADAMPLADLIRELARYHATSLLIAEPDLASTPVSGVFQLSDLDSILVALEHSVGLRSQVLDDGSVQLISAPL
ncbi:MAG: FecR domain-containing protein [Pseudomonadota bacterium]